MFNRLATLRKARSLSRRDLADAVAVNPQTIGCLERGDYAPSLELGMRIAARLGVSVDAMFSLEPFDANGSRERALKDGLTPAAALPHGRSVRATRAEPDGEPTGRHYPPQP